MHRGLACMPEMVQFCINAKRYFASMPYLAFSADLNGVLALEIRQLYVWSFGPRTRNVLLASAYFWLTEKSMAWAPGKATGPKVPNEYEPAMPSALKSTLSSNGWVDTGEAKLDAADMISVFGLIVYFVVTVKPMYFELTWESCFLQSASCAGAGEPVCCTA